MKQIISILGQLIGLGFFLFFLLFIGNPSNAKKTQQEIEGEKVLASLENDSITKVNEEIDAVQKKIENTTQEKEKSLVKRYEKALIMGDSIIEGIADYEILKNTSVIGIRGRRVNNIEEDLKTAVTLSPQIIFLSYGLNDLEYFVQNVNQYIAGYEKDIHYLQEHVKDVKIYVLGILPIKEETMEKIPAYKNRNIYNQALQKMCKQDFCTYIDASQMVKEKDYEPDGIHFAPSFYKPWLTYIADKAHL